jgi:hypothetical protein
MRISVHITSKAVWLLCLLWWVAPVQAQVCTPTSSAAKAKQAAVKYYRRLSLDLRGFLPSVKEVQAVAQAGKVTDTQIKAMLNSNSFVGRIREYHKDLLGMNITDLRLQGGVRNVPYVRVDDKGKFVSYREKNTVMLDEGTQTRRVQKRGANIGCLNEPAKYDKTTGLILCKIQGSNTYKTCIQAYRDRLAGKKNIAQEGYVMVRPYWDKDPSYKVKVCGLTAQTHRDIKYSYSKTNTQSYHCTTNANILTYKKFHPVLCGCGPNLQWCFRSGDTIPKRGYRSMNTEVLQAMVEQTLRVVDKVIRGNRPYTEVLTSATAEVNGPLSHFVNINPKAANRIALPSAAELTVPKLPFYEMTKWSTFKQGTRQAGILTLPFYLLKYATNRARLHRFYNAFLCQYFVPPAGGLPSPDDKCHTEPNLMKRCGCKFCHQTIEPGAAHWGRWLESAWFPILEKSYPKYSAYCAGPKGKNTGYCKNLYMVDPKHTSEEKYKGQLMAYVFSTPVMQANITKGPAELVKKHIADGSIASCTVKKMWSWFVGQDIQKSQTALLQRLTKTFVNSKYNTKTLVQAIVTSNEYRQDHKAPQGN